MTSNLPEKPSQRRHWSDLGPRLLSALVLVPLTCAAIYMGGIWFALLVGGVFAGAYREWEIMVTSQRPTALGFVLIALIAVSALVFPALGIPGTLAVVGIAVLVALIAPGDARFWRAGGVLYIGLVVMAIMSIRGVSNLGIAAGVFLAFSVWLTDSAAFFTGRQVGGIKLSPDISPSKTWSGALGGLAIGTIGGLIIWIFATSSPWWIGVIFAAALSVVGQIGDLAESAIKRRFRIKDSSDLIPGHGGLMDRLDSMASGSLLVFLIGVLHAGSGMIAEGFLIW